MSIAPHTGIVDFGTFTAPTASTDGIQGEVPQPLAGQEGYVLTGTGWASAGSVGLVGYQGTWNALTNTPTLTSSVGVQGYYYVVDVAGTTNLNGITDWQVGDWAIFNGSIWQKVDNTDSYDPANVAITGGTINNTTIGATTPSTGVFTTLTAQNETLKGTGTNLLVQSSSLTTTWTQQNASLTGGQTDPFGGTTAATLNSGTAVATQHSFFQATSYASNVFTLSIYAKAGTANYVGVYLSTPNSGVIFNLATGSVSVNIGTPPSASSITAVSGAAGWYRCSITVSGAQSFSQFFISEDGVALTFTGTSKTITVAAPQLEIGSVLNTYIPTTTTAVYGTPTLSFSGVASIGLQSDGSLYETSAGTGNVRFYTNNIGQEQMRVSHTASAVNYHQLTGSATGSGPIHSVAGSDTNIDLNLTTKGTGAVRFNTGSGEQVRIVNSTTSDYWVMQGSPTILYPDGTSANRNAALSSKGTSAVQLYTNGGNQLQLNVAHTASAVNYVQVTGAATTSLPIISAQGSDTNVGVWLTSKGTGSIRFGSNSTANLQFRVIGTNAAVNNLAVTGTTAGVAPSLSAEGSDTNIPLVLQPKGTGALQAQQTDSTATGGNARGANAVDWQTSRSAAANVASGSYTFIGSGQDNRASAIWGAILSGSNNLTSGAGASITGGSYNTITSAAYSFIGAGSLNVINNASIQPYNFIGAGYSNTANGHLNFIGGGSTNSATSGSAVTTQSGTMNGTTAVTLSGSNANIKVGQYITGTSIAAETYVSAISGTSLTLSKVASGSSTSTLSFYTPHGVVVGGGNNQATGSYSFIGGGGDAGTAANRNVASGDWSVVAGGLKGVASGQNAFVGGGSGAIASGTYAVVSGGVNNQATGFGSTAIGGYNNISNSAYSATLGGNFASTRGIEGISVFGSQTPLGGTLALAQSSLLVLAVQTTDATATVLRSNASAASTTNQVILPNNSAYAFKGTVIANVTGGGNTKAWAIEGAIKRGANAASTALVGTPTVTSAYADVGAATWAITATADTTNGGLAITFTGQAGTTIRVVAKLETTEVTF